MQGHALENPSALYRSSLTDTQVLQRGACTEHGHVRPNEGGCELEAAKRGCTGIPDEGIDDIRVSTRVVMDGE